MKTMTKHTPGPWTAERDGEKLNMIRGKEKGRTFTIAHILSTDKDARLIAAAPELLEAVKKAEEMIRKGNDPDLGAKGAWAILVGELRAAIAKAEGR